MTDEAKALVEQSETIRSQMYLDLIANDAQHKAMLDLIETQAREIERLREALFNATALIGHSVPMDTTALVAGELLTANGVWHQARAALAGDSHDQ